MPVQLVFALRFAATASLARNPTPEAAVGLVSWLSITLSIYLLNGLSDIEGDRLNGSGRPLASGHLSPKTARTVAAVAATLGMMVACSLGIFFTLLAAGMLVLGLSYSLGPAWKEQPVYAGATIGAGAGLTYAAGWISNGNLTTADIFVAAALAAWTATSSSTKDFSDVAGDRLAGRRTLPITLGPPRAAACVIVATATTTIVLVATTTVAGTALLAGSIVAVGSIRIPLGFRAVTNWGDRRSTRRPYRAYMSTQYAATCAMIAVGV